MTQPSCAFPKQAVGGLFGKAGASVNVLIKQIDPGGNTRMCRAPKPSTAAVVRAHHVVGLFVLLLASAAARAQSVKETDAGCSSTSMKLPQMTYHEDVQYLGNAECRTSFLDSIQFIPLSAEGEDRYLSFGFWIRERGEYVSNPNWSDSSPGNAYLMQRYFLHADLHLDERFRFFGELASSLLNGRNGGPRPGVDEETIYVHQAFVDLGLWNSGHDSLTLRAGRQEAALGSENLVSRQYGLLRRPA
jgi:hypothetical protein